MVLLGFRTLCPILLRATPSLSARVQGFVRVLLGLRTLCPILLRATPSLSATSARPPDFENGATCAQREGGREGGRERE
jgi:hypothetical protein